MFREMVMSGVRDASRLVEVRQVMPDDVRQVAEIGSDLDVMRSRFEPRVEERRAAKRLSDGQAAQRQSLEKAVRDGMVAPWRQAYLAVLHEPRVRALAQGFDLKVRGNRIACIRMRQDAALKGQPASAHETHELLARVLSAAHVGESRRVP